MFFVSNLLSSSQAGRRRFESGLPLHLFNDLQGTEHLVEPTFRGNEVSLIHWNLLIGSSFND
jgi:hypothetical protein